MSTRRLGPEICLHENNLVELSVFMGSWLELLAKSTLLLHVAIPEAVNALRVLICNRDCLVADVALLEAWGAVIPCEGEGSLGDGESGRNKLSLSFIFFYFKGKLKRRKLQLEL